MPNKKNLKSLAWHPIHSVQSCKGKKVVLYRSKIKSLVFNLKANMKSLQFNKNDEMMRHTRQADNDAMMS
jgi:hypothetical protein